MIRSETRTINYGSTVNLVSFLIFILTVVFGISFLYFSLLPNICFIYLSTVIIKLTSMIRYTIRNYQNLTRKTTACFSTRVAGDFEFH